MREKWILGGVGATILCLALMIGYIVTSHRSSPQKYISKGTVLFIYQQRSGAGSKQLAKSFLTPELEASYGVVFKQLLRYTNASFITLDQEGGSNLLTPPLVMGVAPRFYPLVEWIVLPRFFKKISPGEYVLKDRYQTTLLNLLSSQVILQNLLRSNHLYLKPYHGYFLLSFSQECLERYTAQLEEKSYNGALVSQLTKEDLQAPIFGIADIPEIIASTPLSLFFNANIQTHFLQWRMEKIKKNWVMTLLGRGEDDAYSNLTINSSLQSLSGKEGTLYLASHNLSMLAYNVETGLSYIQILSPTLWGELQRFRVAQQNQSLPIEAVLLSESKRPAMALSSSVAVKSTQVNQLAQSVLNTNLSLTQVGSSFFINMPPETLTLPETPPFIFLKANFIKANRTITLIGSQNKGEFQVILTCPIRPNVN